MNNITDWNAVTSIAGPIWKPFLQTRIE